MEEQPNEILALAVFLTYWVRACCHQRQWLQCAGVSL